MVLHKRFGGLLFLLCFFAQLAQGEPITLQFWHSMNGVNRKTLEFIIENFNKSQSDVRVVLSNKGSYSNTLNAVVAAYRGERQPHIAQVYEVGTQSMIMSGAIIPVEDLFAAQGVKFDKSGFIGPIANYYSGADGKLYSMPLNSSTPILYYNHDILTRAGVTKIPETWDDLFVAAHTIHAKTGQCGFTFGWQSWTLIENFSAINDIPLATRENGFRGLDVTMNLANPETVRNISRIAAAIQSKDFSFDGRGDSPFNTFIAGNCAMVIDSSGNLGGLQELAKFKWGTAFQPYLAGKKPLNSIIGGASLWVLQGHPARDYKAVTTFLQFLQRPDNQALWHQRTGYLPVTFAAYKLTASEGFYKNKPNSETPIKQLLRGSVTPNSRGVRLGNFSQIRELIEENLEKIWEGRLTAEQGLREADTSSNIVLRRFERLRSITGGKHEP